MIKSKTIELSTYEIDLVVLALDVFVDNEQHRAQGTHTHDNVVHGLRSEDARNLAAKLRETR